MKKNISLFISIFFVMILLSGCEFLTPEDDLNGNNNKIEEFVEELDVEKKGEAEPQATAQGSQQQMQTPPQQPVQKPPVKKSESEEDPVMEEKSMEYSKKYTKATIVTNYGEIKVRFFNEDAPLAVGNFLRLAEEGFYNNTKFHRVIEAFMIQGGDPNSKDDDWSDDGIGGPGYKFRDEINNHKLVRGSLAMANSGPNTNGSQFFIVTADATPHLDGKHTNFGEVYVGMDVVDKIEKVRVDEKNHPTQDAIVEEIRFR